MRFERMRHSIVLRRPTPILTGDKKAKTTGSALILLAGSAQRSLALMKAERPLAPARLWRTAHMDLRRPKGFPGSEAVRIQPGPARKAWKGKAVRRLEFTQKALRGQNAYGLLHPDVSFLMNRMAGAAKSRRLDFLHAALGRAVDGFSNAGYAWIGVVVDMELLLDGFTGVVKTDGKSFASLLRLYLDGLRDENVVRPQADAFIARDFAGTMTMRLPPLEKAPEMLNALIKRIAKAYEVGPEADEDEEPKPGAQPVGDAPKRLYAVGTGKSIPPGPAYAVPWLAAKAAVKAALMTTKEGREAVETGDEALAMAPLLNNETLSVRVDERVGLTAQKAVQTLLDSGIKVLEAHPKDLLAKGKWDVAKGYSEGVLSQEVPAAGSYSFRKHRGKREGLAAEGRAVALADGPSAWVVVVISKLEGDLSDDRIADELVREIKRKMRVSDAVPLTPEEDEVLDQIYADVLELKRTGSLEDMLNEYKDSERHVDALEKLMRLRGSAKDRWKEAKAADKIKERHADAELTVAGKKTRLADSIEKVGREALDPKPAEFDTNYGEMRYNTADEARTAYVREHLERDAHRMMASFGDADDIPIHVASIEREDASTENDRVDRMKVRFILPNGRPQTMRILVPQVGDDGYMFLNGSKKLIANQMVTMPIVKLRLKGEDVVQLNTNYTKAHVSRSRGALSPETAGFRSGIAKLAKEGFLKGPGWEIVPGDSSTVNRGRIHSLEFSELSTALAKVKVGDLEIRFSEDSARAMVENIAKIDLDILDQWREQGMWPIGRISGRLLFSSSSGALWSTTPGKEHAIAEEGDSITKLVLGRLSDKDPKAAAALAPKTSTRKHVHSQVRVLGIRVPIIVFLGHLFGLSETLDAAGVEHEFTDSRKPSREGMSRTVRFQDGWLHCATGASDAYGLETLLLVNGLEPVDTKSYDWSEAEAKGEMWQEHFTSMGRPRFGSGLQNFRHLFLDPITVDVLRDHDLPTDFLEVFLHSSDLLATPTHSEPNDMSLYRVRSAELINHHLYKIVAENIRAFRQEGMRSSGVRRLTVPENALLQALNSDPTIDSPKLLNPVREAELRSRTTYKGGGGIPLAHPKGTEGRRSYSKSMRGVYGLTTPENFNTGITRKLSQNAQVATSRGYLRVNSDADLGASSLLSMNEMLLPFTAGHADPPRFGMAITQNTHQIPTERMGPPLVTSGGHKALAASAKSDFAFRAPEPGKVVSVDMKQGVVKLKYDSGEEGAIDLETKLVSGPSQFWAHLRLEPQGLRPGKRFKKGELLAVNPDYFKPDGANTILKAGALAKFALTPMDTTYEDSSAITESLSEGLASPLIFMSSVSLSKDANIENLVKVGTQVKVGDPLVAYEEALDESGDTERMLDAIGKRYGESIERSGIGRNVKASEHTGEVVDVRLYRNHPISEHSESLQKALTAYSRKHKAREDSLKGTRSKHFGNIRPLTSLEGGKRAGEWFDGVLIEFFILVRERMKVGDKTCLSVALKNIVAEVIPNGQEPLSEHRPDKPVEMVMSPASVVGRMTQDFFLMLWTNKVLYELKEQVREIASEG